MVYPRKPWKHIQGRYLTTMGQKLVHQSEELTKILAFKTINKILFSGEYLDLTIGFKSGESLTMKNYFCPSCAENGYNPTEITQMYKEQFLGMTCALILLRKTFFCQANTPAFWLQIKGLKGQGEVCGFQGPLFIHPRPRVR